MQFMRFGRGWSRGTGTVANPELLTHPWTEGDSIEGWTLAAGAFYSISAGQIKVWRTSSTAERLYKQLTLEVGAVYEINVTAVGATLHDIRVGPSLNFVTGVQYFALAAGAQTIEFTSGYENMYLGYQTNATSEPAYSIGEISLKKKLTG